MSVRAPLCGENVFVSVSCETFRTSCRKTFSRGDLDVMCYNRTGLGCNFGPRRMNDVEEERKQEKVEFDWVDVLAFIIAAYQVIFPFLLGFVGVILVIYLFLYLWAR